ncbi:hypothetical protein [Azospirillum doebereinerae]
MLAVKLCVVAGAFILLAAHVDIGDALAHLLDLEPAYALATAVLVLLTHWTNAAKLALLLPERSVRALFAATLATQAYTLLLPGQIAGEAVKAFRLGRGRALEAGRIVSSVMFDKMTGVAAGLLVTLGGLASKPGLFGSQFAWLAGGGLVALVLLTAGLSWEPACTALVRLLKGHPVKGHPARRAGWGRWIGERLDRFLDTWRGHAKAPRLIALSLLYGVTAQALAVASSMTLALGLGIDIGYAAWCVVIGALTVILLAPVTIGGLGLRELSLVGMLGLMGVSHDQALALALVILAFQLAVAAVGLLVDLLIPPDPVPDAR